MRVLLTGATGFIGEALVSELIQQNFHVSIAVRQKNHLFPDKVKQFAVGDFENNPDFFASLAGIDCIIHLAGRAHVIDKTKASVFDGVMMDNVLEHIEEPEPILKEVRRVLVEGGKFVVGVPGSKGYASDPDHKVFYSKEKLIITLSKAGFVEVGIVGMPLDFDWLDDKISQYCLYGVFRKI